MSHLRVLVCRVEDDDETMTELASLDLPPVPTGWRDNPLDTLEAQVATAGQRLLAGLCEVAWNEVDAAAVARYCRRATRGSMWSDGYDMLTVASRFGTLHLRRRVIAHRDGRPHVMPSNVLLPDHQGLVITRGLQEIACLLPQDVPFATAARLLGWHTGEPGLLSASTLRTLVRDHGDQIRRRETIETICAVRHRGQRRPLVGVPVEQPRRHPGWPEELSAAVETALAQKQVCPPEGVRWADWQRVLAARAEEAQVAADHPAPSRPRGGPWADAARPG